MKAAMMLVNAMAGSFEPKRFKDTYRTAILQTIRNKAKGKKIAAAPKAAAREKDQGLSDIVSALQRSLTARGRSRGGAAKGSKPKTGRGAKVRS